jgi:Rrf2 family protein
LRLSKTQEYALQALIHLATTPDEYRLSREIAVQLGVPAPYLAKILKRFAQHGYVESVKGRGGGYRVLADTLSVPLREVVMVADGHDPIGGCLLGMSKCSERSSCPIHEKWLPLRARAEKILEQQTVGGLARKAHVGRTRLKGRKRLR